MKLERNPAYSRLPEVTYLNKVIFLGELDGIFERYFLYHGELSF